MNTAAQNRYGYEGYIFRNFSIAEKDGACFIGASDATNGVTAMRNSTLSIETVRRVLGYDPETGIFVWKVPTSRKIIAGQQAGVIASNGRRYIAVLGEKILAHRLAWFYAHGVWPNGNIAAKNGRYDDIRLSNLKIETVNETAHRAKVRSTNQSGFRGVSWSASKGKWVATLTRDGRRIHLGYFGDAIAASSVVEAAMANAPQDRGTEAIWSDYRKQRHQTRILWNRISRSETHNWVSFDDFLSSIGVIPSLSHRLIPLDAKKVFGPDNFVWAEPLPKSSAAEASRAHRLANLAQYKDKQLQKDFAISLSDYQRMFVEQKGVCAICARAETEERNGKVKWLAVDHDHSTGEVRALLCHACNKAIGLFGDSVEFLTAAIAYLKRYAKTDADGANVVALVKKESSG